MKAASKARKFIRKAEKAGGGNTDGSIDIREVAKAAGFEIIDMEKDKSETFIGVYVYKNGKKVIFINTLELPFIQDVVIATLMARSVVGIAVNFGYMRKKELGELRVSEDVLCGIFELEHKAAVGGDSER